MTCINFLIQPIFQQMATYKWYSLFLKIWDLCIHVLCKCCCSTSPPKNDEKDKDTAQSDKSAQEVGQDKSSTNAQTHEVPMPSINAMKRKGRDLINDLVAEQKNKIVSELESTVSQLTANLPEKKSQSVSIEMESVMPKNHGWNSPFYLSKNHCSD